MLLLSESHPIGVVVNPAMWFAQISMLTSGVLGFSA